ncbi:hypothetical protein ABT009_12185 [Streptomyces sp. NPDC002896]
MDVFFAPRERGKGIMPTATTYGHHFTKGLKDAGIGSYSPWYKRFGSIN